MAVRAATAMVLALALAALACEPADRLERAPGDIGPATPPAEVVRIHMRAIASGDLSGAYSLVSRDYRLESSAEDFTKWWLANKPSSVEVGDASPDPAFPEARDVLVAVRRADGSRFEMLYVLIREDDRWRIRGQEARAAQR